MKVKLKAAKHLFILLLSVVLSATVIHAQNNTALKLWYKNHQERFGRTHCQ